jgi:hypothetical protein
LQSERLFGAIWFAKSPSARVIAPMATIFGTREFSKAQQEFSGMKFLPGFKMKLPADVVRSSETVGESVGALPAIVHRPSL